MESISALSQEGSISEEKVDHDKWAVLRRLFGYLLKYRMRMVAGAFLALIVSITNLISLATFVPIFNVMGHDGVGDVEVIEIGAEERRKYERWLATGSEPERLREGHEQASYYERADAEGLRLYEQVIARFTHWKIHANNLARGKKPGTIIMWLCALIFPVYLLKLVALTGAIYCIGTAGLRAVRDLRIDLYGQMNKLGLDYFQKERTGVIMSRMLNDAEIVGKSLSVEFNEALVNIFYIITHIAYLAIIDWQLLLITLVIVPVLVTPVSNFATRIRRAYMGQQERLADLSGHIHEIISGIRVIRSFSMERFEKQRFQEINQKLYKNTFLGHYYHQVGPALTEFVATIVVVAFLSYGAFRISDGSQNLGDFIAFFIVLAFIMRPIKQVSVMVNLLSGASAAAARIFKMMDTEPGVENRPDAVPFLGVDSSIRFNDVGYRYPGSDRFAVRRINFEIPRGHTYGLVGSSGAGKTTLMDLVPRFVDVTEGQILIDGRDIRDLNLYDLRRRIGIVSQDVFLFNASVGDNIAYAADGPIQPDRVQEVAEVANAHNFIQELPQGYDTPIGERGVMLSGGQRQRLAIARALLLDPPILVFDEATSNLDNESELLVQQAMARLLKGRTVFIIAHRLSTVARAEMILVLENGQIVERGTHQELIEADATYKRLYDLQFSENG